MNNETDREYENYLESWVPLLHPKSEHDLEPLTQEEFYKKRNLLPFTEEEVMEEHFGHLEPLGIRETIELLAHIK